jgi:hypothetical protein
MTTAAIDLIMSMDQQRPHIKAYRICLLSISLLWNAVSIDRVTFLVIKRRFLNFFGYVASNKMILNNKL